MAKNQNAFRFANEHLQTLLVEAIKSAGFTFQVAEDGTVPCQVVYLSGLAS